MAAAVKTEHHHIVRLAGVCGGGEPVIDGLRVAVRHVVTQHRRGETVLEIAEALGITEAQVFHALSYFADHRDEILALVVQEEQAHARFGRPEVLLESRLKRTKRTVTRKVDGAAKRVRR